MRIPNVFVDPANAEEYPWPINHNEEDTFGKTRSIDHTAPTARASDPGVGLVRQQSDDSPMVLKLKGTILDPTQEDAFIDWWTRSRQRTIFFRDFTNAEYEVIITAYEPQRIRCAQNARGGTRWPYHYVNYTLTMEVLTFRAGPWFDAGVTP
jgi:hypothetical protein